MRSRSRMLIGLGSKASMRDLPAGRMRHASPVQRRILDSHTARNKRRSMGPHGSRWKAWDPMLVASTTPGRGARVRARARAGAGAITAPSPHLGCAAALTPRRGAALLDVAHAEL